MLPLHLAHHAKAQADALSPCDLRDFTEVELTALGFMEDRAYSSSEYAYNMPSRPSQTVLRQIGVRLRLTASRQRDTPTAGR